MSRSWSASPAERARRKQDLLLASKLMRLHADAALRELGEPLDLWAGRVARVRWGWQRLAERPALAAGAGLLAFVMALTWRSRAARADAAAHASRSVAWGRLWSLGWTVWRLWGLWRRVQASRLPAA